MARAILVIKHTPIEGPGSLGDFFQDTCGNLQIIDLSLGQTLPDDPGSIEAVISLGGPMNVYETEEFPFLKDEDAFLKKALSEGVPILGICLGAQLLAKATGARITKAPQKEIGWRQVSLTKEGKADPLFAGLPSRLSVFQWHEDAFEIPPGGALLAESTPCRNQAFRYGRNAYGLQFHVEVTPEMVESWVKEYSGGDIPGETDTGEILKKQASLIYLNFSGIIRSFSKAQAS